MNIAFEGTHKKLFFNKTENKAMNNNPAFRVKNFIFAKEFLEYFVYNHLSMNESKNRTTVYDCCNSNPSVYSLSYFIFLNNFVLFFTLKDILFQAMWTSHFLAKV